MPLGFERINERRQRPNPLINFIKPLPGPSSAYATDFLERVAAISAPIMRAHHIAVMSLEEYEPNPEFVGRNFNAGEVVQLVLRARDGRWLPFRSVQMVMMHELAHCKQMNHSRAFYAVNNRYSAELRELWGRRYTGDGFWSRGKTLLSGEYDDGGENMVDPSLAPKNLCGGTYKSKRRKRKRKDGESKGGGDKLSYADRQQRRILKKFGVGGKALGDDEEKRTVLEGGKAAKGKPRVAGSARGRELRAAAALARFDTVKKEKVDDNEPQIKEEEADTETDSDDDNSEEKAQAAHDRGMLNPEGDAFMKVCEDEDVKSGKAKEYFAELLRFGVNPSSESKTPDHRESKSGEQEKEARPSKSRSEKSKGLAPVTEAKSYHAQDVPHESARQECGVCSLVNTPGVLTCVACANVLDTGRMPDHWRCRSQACAGGEYVNAGDCGVCGVCSAAKSDSL